MWDPTPFHAALRPLAPAAVANDPGLEDFIHRAVLRSGERRPQWPLEALADLAIRQKGFVYDRASGLFFIGGWADHERTASALMTLRRLPVPVDWGRAHDEAFFNSRAADDYIEQGHGFLANSPQLTQGSGSWPLRVGPEVVLTAQEKCWFRDLVVRRQD